MLSPDRYAFIQSMAAGQQGADSCCVTLASAVVDLNSRLAIVEADISTILPAVTTLAAEAAASAGAAATAESGAEDSANAAAMSALVATNLSLRFLPPSATPPTTRSDSSPLQAGDMYLDTSTSPPVNKVWDGAAWIGAEGGVTTFIGLSDAPGSYTGQALKAVRVNAAANALEFYTPSGGGGKPKATSNQTAAMVQGSVSFPQALAIVDGFDYSGTPYTGTVTVPAGYTFGPVDQAAIMGRPDMVQWLIINSAQFPTVHVATGSFTNNLIGLTSAIFGFVSSGIKQFTVSVDNSANSGSAMCPLVLLNSPAILLGNPFSGFTKAILKGAANVGVTVEGCLVEYALLEANAMLFEGNYGAAALLKLDGGVTNSIISHNDFEGGNFVVYTGANTLATIAYNTEQPLISATSGAMTLLVEGRLTVLGTPTIHAASGNASPFIAIGDLILTIGAGTIWQPQTSGEHFLQTANGAIGSAKRIMLDVGQLAVDTSVTATFGNLVHVANTYTAYTTVVDVIGSSQTAWGSNTLYNIEADVNRSGGAYGAFVNDFRNKISLSSYSANIDGGTFTPDGSGPYGTLLMTGTGTVAALSIDLTNQVGYPQDVLLYTDQAVTTVTFSGPTVLNGPSTLAQGEAFVLRYVPALSAFINMGISV